MATKEELYKQLGIRKSGSGFASDSDFWKAVIADSFYGFGYEPTEAEVMSLVPTAQGKGGYERGQAAVANYVQTMEKEKARQENDPLKKFVSEQDVKAKEYETQAQGLYDELRGIISKAPQLFGALTPDQIDQLLAPLQRATAESSARVEGAMARRGLTGGTPETQALAEQERIFRENALATGLQVGLSQQEAERAAIQSRLTDVFNRSGYLTGLVGQGAGQLSAQDLAQLQFLAGLPMMERGVAAQERAIAEATGNKNVLGGVLSGGMSGAMAGGMAGGPWGALAGGIAGGVLGGVSANNSPSGGTTGAVLQQAPYMAMLAKQAYNSRSTGSTALVPMESINYGYSSGGIYNA